MLTPSLSRAFGQINGRTAHRYRLENEILRVSITDFAGALVALEAPDRYGRRDHIVLGFEDVEIYANTPGSFGALLGRNANRIAGGKMVIDGAAYELSANENGSTLHGGEQGFDRRVWEVTRHDNHALQLQMLSVDGDQGFPGDLQVSATYRLEGASLSLIFEARSTMPTPLSLSAHPYFNLDGAAGRDCLDHEIAIDAEAFLPTDERQIPTGEIRRVADTAFDFRQSRRIGERIAARDRQLRFARGYDHYFPLRDPADGARLRFAAQVRSTQSGRILDLYTTQRGLQFYTGNNLDGAIEGRDRLYRQSAGFALEPQGFPDAVHHPHFPSTILRPGQIYHEEILYRFSADAAEASR